MRNYCSDCAEILQFPIEWDYGLCAECLAIRLERAELFSWEDEGGSYLD